MSENINVIPCPDRSYNFCHPLAIDCEWVKKEIFNLEKEERINLLPETMEDLVVSIGFMPSKTQARKNGFSGPFLDGLNNYTFGKNRIKVWTYVPTPKVEKLINRLRKSVKRKTDA